MITIYYPLKNNKINGWKARLDHLPLSYTFVEQDATTIPLLVDGEIRIEGIPAIEEYLDGLDGLVAGWYEDRCDNYEFDPDAKKTSEKEEEGLDNT